MGNKMLENAEDSLALLRNKVKEGKTMSDFRKKLIGGISEEDVEDYINTIRLQSEYKENKLNEKIEELISFNDKLKIEYNTYVKNAEEEKKKLLKDLEETKQNLQNYIDQGKTSDESEEKYKMELSDIRKKFDEKSSAYSELHSKSKNFNEELNSMYKELEGVKEQVKMNYDLQRQLEQERMKTETVEKEMTDFFKRIIEINNK